MADYDAIVVGAGHNGLVSALYLAKAGWKVLVLERAAEIGGAVRSAELTLPGFVHDLYATNLAQFAASPAYRDFEPELTRAGLRFLFSAFPYASAYADGRALRVYQDRARTEREVAGCSAEDVTAWRALVDFFQRTAPRFLPLFFTALPSRDAAWRALRMAATAPGDALRLWRILRETPRSFVDRHFHAPEVKGLLAPWALHMDYGPDVAGGATFAFVAGLSGHLRGLCVAEGGAGRLTAALARVGESLGAEIRTRTDVVRIGIKGGRATDVALAGGETIAARRCIIASVTPRLLFGQLVADEHLPGGFGRRIEKFRYGPSTFVVHMALDRALAWRAAEDLAQFNYVHLYAGAGDMAETYADSLAGRLPKRPLLVVSQTTPLDPSRAPPGKHVARIHVRVVPSAIEGDAAGSIRARDWAGAAEPFAERMLDLLAEHAPNVRQALLALRIVTPPEIEADNVNLVGGDCVSGSHHLDQNFLRRPVRGWSRYATPIRDLYMTGASTWPGGGVHGASGYLVARRLLA